jgi:peptide chain release factor subunit 1
MMRRFMKEVAKTGAGLATYGESHVRRALEMGAVETLLVSETLRKVRVAWKCPSCGQTHSTTAAAAGRLEPASCPKCATPMEEQARTDLIRELTEGASRYGTQVALISGASDEGKILLTAFGGLGAILRFSLG